MTHHLLPEAGNERPHDLAVRRLLRHLKEQALLHRPRPSDAQNPQRTLGDAAQTLGAADCTAPAGGLAVVGDRSATPVPIHPPGKFRADPLLRTPDEAQRRKLEACGATAGLTLSLTVSGKPWGLVVCHHPTPRLPEFERQSAIGLFAQMLGLLIALREGAG